MPKTILIISHGHPSFSKGGGELAAYNFYKRYEKEGYNSYFMATHHKSNITHDGTPFSMFNEKEILFHNHMDNYFFNTISNREIVLSKFNELLNYIKPDVIHFHHYLHVGLELIRTAKNYFSDNGLKSKVFLTLHEYIAICPNNGQMVKTKTNKLCYKATPIECAQCFPERDANEFKLRELSIKSYLKEVDYFISPSHFLKRRYVEWGVDEGDISVIDNGQEKASKLAKREITKSEKRSAFAFFGQINPYKGVDILLQALEYIPKKLLQHVEIQVHGSGLDIQDKKFQKKIKILYKNYNKNVKFFGAYEPNELEGLMQNIDWVVMPSIWWENSPLVIQEALKYGRPLMVSNIGGMAEKVQHLKNGVHFKYGNPRDLARYMISSMEQKFYDDLYDNIEEPVLIEDVASKHLKLYEV